MNRIALAFVVAMFPCGFPRAAELSCRPVPVGDSGPLLFLVHPEDETGKAVSGRDRRKEVLYLYDPNSHKSPQPLWEGHNPRPSPIARLQPNRVAMEYRDRTYVLRLDSGSASPVLPGEEQTKVIHVDGASLLVLKRTAPYSPGGYKLGRQGDPPVIVTREYYRPRDYLYRFDPSLAEPVLLANVPLEKVLTVNSNEVWAITAGANRKLCKISKQGGVEEIIGVDDHWVAPEIRLAFSSGGKFLALAALHDEHDFHKERELMVIQLAQKKVIWSRERVRISDLDLFGGRVAELPLRWMAESVLSYDTFMTNQVDVEKGNTADGGRGGQTRGAVWNPGRAGTKAARFSRSRIRAALLSG